MTQVQLVGKTCAVCSERIGVAKGVGACACGAVLHDACRESHVCARPDATATPAKATGAEAPRRARWWMWIGPVLGVSLAAGISPMIREHRWNAYVKERAARDLGCDEERVEIAREGGTITGRGCDDFVEYLVICDQPGRAQCLEQTNVTARETNEIIDRRLGR